MNTYQAYQTMEQAAGVGMIILVVVLILHILVSFLAARSAKGKGHSFICWFLLSFFLGLPVYIIIAGLPDYILQDELSRNNKLLERMLRHGNEA